MKIKLLLAVLALTLLSLTGAVGAEDIKIFYKGTKLQPSETVLVSSDPNHPQWSQTYSVDRPPTPEEMAERQNLIVENADYKFGGDYFIGMRSRNIVLDGKEWISVGVEVEGSTACAHAWVYSETFQEHAGMSCAVMHNGFHCSWGDLLRNKICSLCGRLEKEEEIWHEHLEVPPDPPKSEYEIIVDSFTKKK